MFCNNLISFCTEVKKCEKISLILAIVILLDSIWPRSAIFCFSQNITLDTMLLRTLWLYSICATLEDLITDEIAFSGKCIIFIRFSAWRRASLWYFFLECSFNIWFALWNLSWRNSQLSQCSQHWSWWNTRHTRQRPPSLEGLYTRHVYSFSQDIWNDPFLSYILVFGKTNFSDGV